MLVATLLLLLLLGGTQGTTPAAVAAIGGLKEGLSAPGVLWNPAIVGRERAAVTAATAADAGLRERSLQELQGGGSSTAEALLPKQQQEVPAGDAGDSSIARGLAGRLGDVSQPVAGPEAGRLASQLALEKLQWKLQSQGRQQQQQHHGQLHGLLQEGQHGQQQEQQRRQQVWQGQQWGQQEKEQQRQAGADPAADRLAGDASAGAFVRRKLLAGEAAGGGSTQGSSEQEQGGQQQERAASEDWEETPMELAVFSTPHHSQAAAELAKEKAGGAAAGGGETGSDDVPDRLPATTATAEALRKLRRQDQQEGQEQRQGQQAQHEEGLQVKIDPVDLKVFDTGAKLPQPGQGGTTSEAASDSSRAGRQQQSQQQQRGEAGDPGDADSRDSGAGDAGDATRVLTNPDETVARFEQRQNRRPADLFEKLQRQRRLEHLQQQQSSEQAPGQQGRSQSPDAAQQAQQLSEQAQQLSQRHAEQAAPQVRQRLAQEGRAVRARAVPDAFAQAQLAQQAAWRERRQQAQLGQQAQQQQQQHRELWSDDGPVQQAEQAALGVAAGAALGTSQQHEQREQRPLPVRRVQHIPVVDVAVMTIMMAAAAGLGALPFFFVRSLSPLMSGLATAVACGVMFACSFDLVHTGQPYGAGLVVVGVVLGGLFIRSMQQWLETVEDVEFENLKGAGARKTLLLVGVMAAHALGEGCGVGVSFSGDSGWSQGVLTTLAIGIHNVPEGLAKATVLVGQGVSARQALLWSVLTCLPQPLVAIPSFLFVEAFEAILPIALGFAGGCMIWIVFAELLPDAFTAAPPKQVASAATLAAAGLEGVRMLFEQLDQQGLITVPNPFPGDPWLLLAALGVMLPAVAAAALAGGLLSNAGLPSPVNYGLASGLMGCMGLLPLLRVLLPLGGRLVTPGPLHVVAGAASGAALALLLRHQLLQVLRRKGFARTAISRSAVDLEAAAKKGSDSNLLARLDSYSSTPYINGGSGSAAHMYATAYNAGNISFSNGSAAYAAPAGEADGSLNGGLNGGLGHAAKAAMSPRHLGLDFLGAWGMHALKAGERNGGFKLAAPQYAATLMAALVLALHTVPQGWRATRSMAAVTPDLSTLLLPAALCLMVLGGAAGALTAATFAPSAKHGAWAGGLLACCAALWSLLSLARYDGTAPGGTAYDPFDLTGRLGAVTEGALCTAALVVFGVGWSLHPRRARGGALLGAVLALAVYGFQGALCLLTPYCLS
ncbi:hypothetical protein N2152v2_007146 [Parachlorella kessleri]